MTEQTAEIFLLDTNVFIEAYRRYYSMDLCPGFWKCLEHYCQKGQLLSIDRVQNEISEGDELGDWVKQAPDELFASTAEQEVLDTFSNMMAWVRNNGYFREEAKNEFARVADGWLVAHAKVNELVVVTQESFDENTRKRVKIPNVCREFGVPYQDTFTMLRSLGVCFDWK